MSEFLRSLGQIKLAILLLTLLSVASLGNAQSVEQRYVDGAPTESDDDTRFVMNLRFDDAKISELKSTGFLKSDIPEDRRNRIDGILMNREFSFIDSPATADHHVEKRNDVLIVHVNDAILDRLDYQPFLSKIYYSNFSSVLIAYQPTPFSKEFTGTTSRNQVGSTTQFFARIDEKRGIRGSIEGLDRLKLKTEFGSVEIDLDQIEGMRFQPDQPSNATVWLSNEDRVSGQLEFDQINMICSWGVQPLKLADLESITRSRFTQLPELPTNVAAAKSEKE